MIITIDKLRQISKEFREEYPHLDTKISGLGCLEVRVKGSIDNYIIPSKYRNVSVHVVSIGNK